VISTLHRFHAESDVNDFTPPVEAYAFRTSMPRILIVDDSPTIRKMVRASLRTLEAFDFIEAANGLQAIEQVALGPVALMILDLNMPDMHGVDVLKFLRRHPSSREVPVVVLTTRGDDSSREAAVAAGATQYMTKPFLPQSLLDTARELLRGAAS
jgi:two-component system chemotaxis response regulator CheY